MCIAAINFTMTMHNRDTVSTGSTGLTSETSSQGTKGYVDTKHIMPELIIMDLN